MIGVLSLGTKCYLNSNPTLKRTFNIKKKSLRWRVREKRSEVIDKNMSNKEKSGLRNLIHAKNKSIIINDTDKNTVPQTWIKQMPF